MRDHDSSSKAQYQMAMQFWCQDPMGILPSTVLLRFRKPYLRFPSNVTRMFVFPIEWHPSNRFRSNGGSEWLPPSSEMNWSISGWWMECHRIAVELAVGLTIGLPTGLTVDSLIQNTDSFFSIKAETYQYDRTELLATTTNRLWKIPIPAIASVVDCLGY